ncbi:hypothetical protein GCM10010149_86780 [Nonomuraea roseoviolacea subsp. roseoviolacea]|uniref:hypothetical protein n=1 Tax=Nonomuraea roseoviolacea TaxID=103837 RepID=UPI0031D63DF7
MTVARNADGRLEVFAVNGNGVIPLHVWQVQSDGGWSDWQGLGGPKGLDTWEVRTLGPGFREF